MGITKTNLFSEDVLAIADLLKAMGHPARILIVQFLLEKNTCVCGEIVDELPLAQATVSQHLKALKSAGIIQGTISGKSVCYCLDPTKIEEIENFFTQISSKSKKASQNCC